MANTALAVLETALRARKLDRTLTTALPPLDRSDPAAYIPFDIAPIDTLLGGVLGGTIRNGGLPRGQVSELAGPHSSGRTTLLLHVLGAATRGGEIAALIDTCDRLDAGSASAAGIDLDCLLWIRGEPSASGQSVPRIVDRAIKALNLVLQAGGFAVVALDLADIQPRVLKSLPFTTWLRLQRIIEGSDTACLLVTPEPLARSAGGLTMMCTGRTTWTDASERSGRLTGLETGIQIVSPRRRVDGSVSVTSSAP